MTTTSVTERHASGHDTPIRAVLFDLSGTLLDERYLHRGVENLALQLHQRWGIDPTVTRPGFMVAFRAVSQEYAHQSFYLMRDVICRAVRRLIVSSGHSATRSELFEVEQRFWKAAIPTATPAEGAIHTLARLRDLGIKTGIVSYADTPVFEGLLEQLGLAGTTDIEICSEMARSCKPHHGIFLQALRCIDVDPGDAMFVGDTVDTDIVGGNRLGMRTALLSAREFALGAGSTDDADTQPDHLIERLADVVDIVTGSHYLRRSA